MALTQSVPFTNPNFYRRPRLLIQLCRQLLSATYTNIPMSLVSMQVNEDEDYIPSQDLDSLDEGPVTRGRRALQLAAASHKLDELYRSGGALDSQTTDSQYVAALTPSDVPHGVKQEDINPKEMSVKPNAEPLETNTSICDVHTNVDCAGCSQCKQELLVLRCKVEHLENMLELTNSNLQLLQTSIQSLEARILHSVASSDDDDDEDDKFEMRYQDGTSIWMRRSNPSQDIVSPPHRKRRRITTPSQNPFC
ncbi:hypothetical protein BC629DRAFT_1601559 [Irpex lacteus]|nr:hypothetical protein BC629DRAFT_1601559 [Irpex lacteus]